MEIKRHYKKFKLLDRKKTNPEKFIFTGVEHIEKTDIQLFKYNEKEYFETKELSPADIEKFDDDNYMHWLNIYGISDPDLIASVCKKQQILNLTIQDILDINQRPKYQELEGYGFLTIKSVVPSDSELYLEQISFVFGKNFLLSFQEKKADYFEHLRYRIRENSGIIRERGPDLLLFTMLESILDNYFKALQLLENDIEKSVKPDINKEPSPSLLEKIEQNKRQVHLIRKTIQPIKDFTLAIEREENLYIEKRNLKFFFEIKDLCLMLLDNCDIIESSLESNTNLFFSIQGHRMNQVMKTLTIIATIFIPLTFIAGIYGMNFQNMPELKWKYGYMAVWLLMAVVLSGMIYYLRKKKWF